MAFTLGEFAAHLMGVEADVRLAQERACKRALQMVEREAKGAIGHYKMAYGPWPQLKESTQDERERLGYARNKPLLREGDLWESISHDGPHRSGNEVYGFVGSPSKIAAYQELGTAHIPPRPFIGPAARIKEHDIHRMAGRMVASAVAGGGPNVHMWRKAFEYVHRGYENLKEALETDEDKGE